MRYWVYINDKVDGPYDENKLVTLNGFSKDTLICSEEVASGGGQEWVKASSIFEFDEVPVQEAAAEVPSASNVATAAADAVQTASLLAKLDSLTQEISHLQQKLDSMQTHLDEALEQNKQLAQQAALQQAANDAISTDAAAQPDSQPTLKEATQAETPVSFPEQAAPKEEELIIRSALDSIYGEKVVENTQADDAIQDLLPQKETEKVEEIERELTFTPVEEKPKEAEVKEALITTPSAEDVTRDELINELTASPKEDILDQIIQEHQEQEKQPQQPEDISTAASTESDKDSSWLGAAAATVGAAAIAGFALKETEEKPALSEEPISTPEEAPALAIATDRTDPSHLEEVLPAQQMPADVPAPAESAPQDMPNLETLSALDDQEAAQESSDVPTEAHSQGPAEDTIEELVPGAVLENKQKSSDSEDFYIKEENKEEEPADHPTGLLTDKDLEDAFGPQEEVPVSQTTLEVPENNNPNDLTEIELKEGSTYLISDFVPPAQFAAEESPAQAQATPEQALNKQEETIIQDMLAVTNKNETTQEMSTEGLPEDAEATKVSLENTIQAKRGAALDIKTVPMVPEPADSTRLDVDSLDDVNTQHDVKTHKSGGKLTKVVIGVLVGLLALIILYVLLGILKVLPNSVNVFANEKPTAALATEEFFPEPVQPVTTEEVTVQEEVQTPSPADEALTKVQGFPLPNGLTLKQFIETKHADVASDLITWEITDAVEPDNYSITVKVPPANPQNFKTVYRFNYNTQSGLLDPTISDSKNLLDQAYGTQA